MKIKDLVFPIESKANLTLQESYDNSGLIVGSYSDEVTSALIALDCTEEIIEEAIEKKHDVIITHHPILFSGLKKINGKNYVEKIIIKAIKNEIAIYSAHTNLDNYEKGVNSYLAQKLGLIKNIIIAPKNNLLFKLSVFCPKNHAEKVRVALFKVGGGKVGNYDNCSFNTEGKGTFRALKNSNPFVGKKGSIHTEEEIKVEIIAPVFLKKQLLAAMFAVHPYEEVAYDIYPLQNECLKFGAGLVGELKTEQSTLEFLKHLKKTTGTKCIKHTKFIKEKIKKVAICGGAGSFLINEAKNLEADVFITGDIKYHQFFEAENKIIIADIGHYESEQFTMQLIFDIIKEIFPNFAVSISEVSTNPINYFI